MSDERNVQRLSQLSEEKRGSRRRKDLTEEHPADSWWDPNLPSPCVHTTFAI